MKNAVKKKVVTLLLEFSLCKNKNDAIQWYKNSQLESCGNKTAEELVENGQSELVISHIKHIAD